MKNRTILVLDDLRTLCPIPPELGVLCRVSQHADIFVQSQYIKIDELWLDHDLSLHSLENGAQFLERLLKNHRCPPNVRLITMNPVGRTEMVASLKHAGYEYSEEEDMWVRLARQIDGYETC